MKTQKTKHSENCSRVFKNYDMTCPRCLELANGAAPRPGWGDRKFTGRYNPKRSFAHVYCACADSHLWDSRCPSCGKMVYTD